MRSRRSRTREPVRWARTLMQNDLEVTPGDVSSDIVVLFDPFAISSNAFEEDVTVRRIICADLPVFAMGDSTLIGQSAGVVQLKWYIYVTDNVEAIGIPQMIDFQNGEDLLGQGSTLASVFDTGVFTPWSFMQNGPWIDVRVARRISKNDKVCLGLEAAFMCGTAMLDGEVNPAHWCVRTDISVLSNRSMRKR